MYFFSFLLLGLCACLFPCLSPAPRTSGSMLPLVPGMVDLLLFKSFGHGIETLSNGEEGTRRYTVR